MTAVFIEVQRTCPHCGGRGQSPVYYSHGVALDLLADAADALRFSADEARKLYRLAAKYEDDAAHQAGAQPWKTRASWAALHRRNAIYLRALADASDLSDVHRRRITMEIEIVAQPTKPNSLSIVIAEPRP